MNVNKSMLWVVSVVGATFLAMPSAAAEPDLECLFRSGEFPSDEYAPGLYADIRTVGGYAVSIGIHLAKTLNDVTTDDPPSLFDPHSVTIAPDDCLNEVIECLLRDWSSCLSIDP